MTIDHCIQKPRPICFGDIGNEPWVSLPMESDFRREAELDQEVGYQMHSVQFRLFTQCVKLTTGVP